MEAGSETHSQALGPSSESSVEEREMGLFEDIKITKGIMGKIKETTDLHYLELMHSGPTVEEPVWNQTMFSASRQHLWLSLLVGALGCGTRTYP